MSVGYSNNTHALAANPTHQGASNPPFDYTLGYANPSPTATYQARTSPHVLDPLAIVVNTFVGIVVPVRFRNVEGISNADRAKRSKNAAGFSTSGATGADIASQFASGPATGAASASQAASQGTPVIG